MIDAVEHACKTWGWQKRQWFTDNGQGFPGQNFMAEVKDYRDGASSKSFRVTQFTEEAHRGDGLLIARALDGAPEMLQWFAFVHYVVPKRDMRVKAKAHWLGLSIAEYWRVQDRLHYWIAGRVPRGTFVDTKKPLIVDTEVA